MQASANFSNVVKKEKKIKIVKIATTQTLLYIVLTIFAIVSIFPFIFMILSSFMTNDQYRSFQEITDMWPANSNFQYKNYVAAFANESAGMTFTNSLINTLLVAAASTILGMIVLILTSFAFARLQFKGRNLIFALLLATMMIPGELFTITNYVTISRWGLNNTLSALIYPFLVSVYYIYLLRNSFMQIPDELYKAAKIDGVSDFKYLIKVMIPLAMPTLISIFILKIIAVWNSYIWPQLVNKNGLYLLLSNWMASSGQDPFGDSSQTVIPIKMAAAVITTVPLLIVFLCFRRYIMKGVSKSGIKG